MTIPSLILKPIITERSLTHTSLGQYTFNVPKKSNKYQIKAAVEHQFSVHVLKVHTLGRPAVIKRTGRRRLPSRAAPTKLAIVTLKTGESISVFETQT